MGLIGGGRQRALAQFKGPRNVGADGSTLAEALRPGAAPAAALPSGYPMTPDAVLAGGFPMPGVIGGYGGGTFNLDGTQATPAQRGDMPPEPMQGLATVGNPSGIIGRSAGNPSLFQMPNIDGSPMTFEGVKPAKPQGKGGFFRKNGPWLDVLGAIGDGLSGNPIYQNAKMQRIQMEQQHGNRLQDRQWQIEDRNWKASQPDYFTSGRDRVKLNPLTGQTEVVYDGPEDFDEYATALGMEPGSDEYESAVLDYVLRGHGPTALGYDKQLDDFRTENDKGYDDYRTRNRLKVRQTPTYRDNNPLPPRTTRKRAAPAVTAKNPKTGETISLNSRGQWVDKNGRPVQ